MNHEPEDLLREGDLCSLEAGEQVRMKERVQSSGSTVGLGDFLFEPPATISSCSNGVAGGSVVSRALANG